MPTVPSWLEELSAAVSGLHGVPFRVNEDDSYAEFAFGPYVDIEGDCTQQLVDFIDLWLPLDEPIEELVPLISRGPFGLDRVCDWLKAYLSEYSVNDAGLLRVQRRVKRLTALVMKMCV